MIFKSSKCYLGYADLQFVGKVISQEGLRMSQSEIQLVLDFPCPTESKQLKNFLGLVNYFRDFIRNQSTIVRSLHALLTNYQKTERIVWTPEATSAFNEIKEQVSKCTTIHLISDTAHGCIWLWYRWLPLQNYWRKGLSGCICKQISFWISTPLVHYSKRSLCDLLFLYFSTITFMW